MSKQSNTILVIGPSWVGDMVMAQSLFMTLKQRYPYCAIDVLAPGWSLPLLERMPEVRKGIVMTLGHGQFGLAARRQLGLALKTQQYRQAIVLPNSWKSALAPWFAGIPQRIGYLGECRWGLLNEARRLDKNRLTKTVQRFVALGLPETLDLPNCPQPRLQISHEQQLAVQSKFNVSTHCKIIALCPGAEYGPAKRWPIEHFAVLAKTLMAQGWQVWIMGSDKDKAVAEAIDQQAEQGCRVFAGQTQLAEAVDLMSLADVVVSNDSGLMHVAAALDKPVIALYGSSDPAFTPPLHPQAQILSLGLDCSPCFKRECPLGHLRCLQDISPQQVLALL